MNLLKFFDGKEWIALYREIISNCLVKSKNLSDLENLIEARKNLDISGENCSSHFHDDRYLPKIQEVKDEAINLWNQKSLEINEELRAVKECVFGQIMIQESEPNKPTDNQVWLCTNKTNPHISVYKKGEWIKLT